MIITRTPYRVSFFGGGTDYPTWFREETGSVLATSIDKYCYITCRLLPPYFEHKHRIVYSRIENAMNIEDIEHPAVRGVFQWDGVKDGLEIHHDGDVPARSGLGSSSSFTVGLILALKALRGQMIGKQELAANAIHVEQNIIKENVGSQDQISAAYGGFNRIDFHKDGSFTVNPVVLPKGRFYELQSHMMLCFTGLSRIASEVAKSQIDNMKNRYNELKCMHQMVDQSIDILTNPNTDLLEFGKLMNESWKYKRSLSDKVSNSDIDEMYEIAMQNGAVGGKILGAGGGGFLLVFAPPEKQAAIREKLGKLVHIPFKFEGSGARVALYQPNGL
ncbi:MAG: kinase [Alphaproteobacteria bacterium]|jgi:D-glycero-alpha-D-manno-heptose-7-phosphate kinase|nr:kinase [Alphaproteobacteria bacterium]